MSEFSDSDYRGLLVNVHEKKGKDLLKEYPDLKLFPEFDVNFLPPLNRDKILTWVVLVYDKESPFRKKYADLEVRKYHAAIEAGFQLNSKGKFDDYIEELFSGANPLCLDMIIAYCKYHYSVKYSFLVMMEALFFTNLKTAVAGLGANKMVELKQIQEAMETAQRELLAFDSNKELVKTLYKKINSDKIELAPEDIARKLKEGKTTDEILE